jgi:hypothetical protein
MSHLASYGHPVLECWSLRVFCDSEGPLPSLVEALRLLVASRLQSRITFIFLLGLCQRDLSEKPLGASSPREGPRFRVAIRHWRHGPLA